MARIDKNQFNQALSGGVNLKDPKLAEKLSSAGVSLEQVKAADLDRDGVIKSPAELARAFQVVDSFDHDGSDASFDRSGKAGAVYDAFVGSAGRAAPAASGAGKFADKIVAAGLDRQARYGNIYAKDQAPVSPNRLLTGNSVPGQTRLSWLKGFWKCNQFVGDSLTQAGVKAPLIQMKDGSHHYAPAEQWPGHGELFDRVTDPSKMRAGDVLVRDFPGSGDATAHIEIVTSVEPFRSVGMHYDGASVTEGPSWLEGGTYLPAKRAFSVDGDTVYVLRPKVAL